MANIWKRVHSNIRKETLLNISNFLILSLSFLVLGVFISLVVGSQTALRNLEKQAQITIFFKDDFPANKILDLKKNLEADTRVATVNYVSKEDAYKLFTELNKNEPSLLDSVTASILPASLEVRAVRLGDLSSLASEYNKIDGVEDVKHFDDVVSRFRFWSNVVYIIGFVLVAVFFVISYSVVLATLRTTINSKGVEYEIMKLVGATDMYVKKPIEYQGMLLGVLSGVFSGLLLLIIISGLYMGSIVSENFSIAFIYGVSLHPVLYGFLLAVVLGLSGLFLGAIGSRMAIKRYLQY